MSSDITVFHYGVHRGEERIIMGNERAGMINFSGCHLSCKFCYTPETSIHIQGGRLSQAAFMEIMCLLKKQEAQNLNLVSPTHLWRHIESPLNVFKDANRDFPIIFKLSGFESPELIRRMRSVSDVFVPDFKVCNPARAYDANLPKNYGDFALAAVKTMQESHGQIQWKNGRISRGIVVRHLLMPDHLEDSLAIIEKLNSIAFQGVLNLMTHFWDASNERLISAPETHQKLLIQRACQMKLPVLINGKVFQTKGASDDMQTTRAI